MSRFISRWDAECENWSYVQDSMKKLSKKYEAKFDYTLNIWTSQKKFSLIFLREFNRKRSWICIWGEFNNIPGFFVLRFEGLYRCRAIIGKRNDFASEGIMQDIESLYTFKELFNINNCCTFFCSSCSLSETETLLWTRQMLWTNIPRLSKSREMVVGN